MKRSVKGIAFAMSMLMCTSFGVSVSAADEVAVNAANFPDEVFRGYVSENFDTDGSGGLSESEIKAVTKIDVSGTEEACGNVQSLEGVEYFTALTSLNCRYNQLTSLDVSKNTALEMLQCNDNQLTDLDVSKNTALKYLYCYVNQLKNVDVSKNSAIQVLNCYGTQITNLDVSSNTNLRVLVCSVNKLTSLDVSNNSALGYLDCNSNLLTSLDVSNNTALTDLYCQYNKLTSLDVSNNTALTKLECFENYFYIGNVSSYNLANFPKGYDPAKASNWTGATYDSATNTITNFTSEAITYDYDCGNGKTATFILIVDLLDPVESFVNRLYTILLGRNAEPDGLEDWTNRLKSGTATSAEIVSGIAGSQEFANFGLSNEEIVERMYLAMLDRPSDAAGKASWVNGLNSGMTVNGIVNGFSGSQEFGQICAEYGIQAGSVSNLESRDKSAGLTSFIARMYTKALGRSYDVAGLNDWTNRYLTGTSLRDISYGFIFSQEFVNKHLSDSDYVDTLYRTFFDREPDDGGKSDWMSKLAGGMSREEVLDGFVNSQECANLVASFGI